MKTQSKLVEQPTYSTVHKMHNVKVLHEYGGAMTAEARILPGVYPADASALHGAAQYLIDNGHAVWTDENVNVAEPIELVENLAAINQAALTGNIIQVTDVNGNVVSVSSNQFPSRGGQDYNAVPDYSTLSKLPNNYASLTKEQLLARFSELNLPYNSEASQSELAFELARQAPLVERNAAETQHLEDMNRAQVSEPTLDTDYNELPRDYSNMSKTEITARLDQLGVGYKANASQKDLAVLLAKNEPHTSKPDDLAFDPNNGHNT